MKKDWVTENFSTLPPKPKGWKSISDIVEQTGINERTLRYRISNMMQNGELDVMSCLDKGKVTKCYKPKKE